MRLFLRPSRSRPFSTTEWVIGWLKGPNKFSRLLGAMLRKPKRYSPTPFLQQKDPDLETPDIFPTRLRIPNHEPGVTQQLPSRLSILWTPLQHALEECHILDSILLVKTLAGLVQIQSLRFGDGEAPVPLPYFAAPSAKYTTQTRAGKQDLPSSKKRSLLFLIRSTRSRGGGPSMPTTSARWRRTCVSSPLLTAKRHWPSTS